MEKPTPLPDFNAMVPPEPKFKAWDAAICWQSQPVRILGSMIVVDISGKDPKKVWRYIVQPDHIPPTMPLQNSMWVDERDLIPATKPR